MASRECPETGAGSAGGRAPPAPLVKEKGFILSSAAPVSGRRPDLTGIAICGTMSAIAHYSWSSAVMALQPLPGPPSPPPASPRRARSGSPISWTRRRPPPGPCTPRFGAPSMPGRTSAAPPPCRHPPELVAAYLIPYCPTRAGGRGRASLRAAAPPA